MKNKKTTAAGISMLLPAVLDIVQGLVSGDHGNIHWETDIMAISGFVGFFLAKDHDVTGGTVMQPSSTDALMKKAEEKLNPEVLAVQDGFLAPSTKAIENKAVDTGTL